MYESDLTDMLKHLKIPYFSFCPRVSGNYYLRFINFETSTIFFIYFDEVININKIWIHLSLKSGFIGYRVQSYGMFVLLYLKILSFYKINR